MFFHQSWLLQQATISLNVYAIHKNSLPLQSDATIYKLDEYSSRLSFVFQTQFHIRDSDSEKTKNIPFLQTNEHFIEK